MSDDFPLKLSLFNAPPPDNDEQRATLARELRVAKGFTLIFALCNSAAERARQMNALWEDVPELRIQDVLIRKQVPHLLDVLRATLDDPAPDAVFVHGLENWIPSDANPRAVPFLLNLNAARNHFIADCPCPLVLWMPDYLLRLIIGGAPDFASVRSGLYVFTTSPAEAQFAIQTLRSLGFTATAGLPLEDKQQRLKELEELLFNIHLAPQGQNNGSDEWYISGQLATIYFAMGQYEQAETLLIKIVEMARKLLPKGHSQIAVHINNLAALYEAQGRYLEAEQLLKEALDISQKALPESNLNLATHLNNLATLYEAQGRYLEAEPLSIQALEIRKTALPAGHPDTATSLNNLASLYESQNRFSEAEPLYKEALAMRQTILPKGHPDIAGGLNNLAGLYRLQGRYTEAEQYLNDALVMLEQSLGIDHPNTIRVRNNFYVFQIEKEKIDKS